METHTSINVAMSTTTATSPTESNCLEETSMMPPPLLPESDVKVSDSSVSRFLPSLFRRKPAQAAPPPGERVLPRRSSLSTLPPRKRGAKVELVVNPWDMEYDIEDGSQERQKREEDNLSRLVQMAKQHNTEAANFEPKPPEDDSESWTPIISNLKRLITPRASPRPSPTASPRLSPMPWSSGPVDVDNGEIWDVADDTSVGLSSTASEGSSNMRRFLPGGFLLANLPPTNRIAYPVLGHRTQSMDSADTPIVSNVTPTRGSYVDAGLAPLAITSFNGHSPNGHSPGEGSFRDERSLKSRVPSFRSSMILILFVIFVLAVVISVVSVLVSSRSNNTSSVEGQETSPATLSPIFNFTSPPTESPSQSSISPAPSIATSSEVPTVTQQPTNTPSPSPAPSNEGSFPLFESLKNLTGEQLGEEYGYAVSMSGEGSIVAIGARSYSSKNLTSIGRVQVLAQMKDGTWIPVGQTLYGRNSRDQFGSVVALSSLGQRLAVSEPNFNRSAGNVRVFDLSKGKDWELVGQEIGGAEEELLGASIALSGDGRRLAVGCPFHGSDFIGRVRVFELSNETWKQVGDPLDGTDKFDKFGWVVDLSPDGNQLVVGAPNNTALGGYVRAFEWVDDSWKQWGSDIVNDLGDVKASDRFGMALSLSDNRVAISAPRKNSGENRNTGLVAVYENSGSESKWSLMGENGIEGNLAEDELGWSLQLSNNTLVVGMPGSQQVIPYQWQNGRWDLVQNRLEGGPSFGRAVAASMSGNVIAVGDPQRAQDGLGTVQVFQSRSQ